MKNIIPILFVLFSFVYSSAQSLYDLNKIQEIRITFPYNNWGQKLDSLHTVDTDARLIATKVILNGISFDSVGIRYKGNSTYNASRNKNPFNIKLDYIRSSQKYEGFTTLKLSSGFMDPSFLREVLGYKITRQYLPASQANFINVYVNDVLIGLYTNVQNVDNDFLKEHYFSSDNALFQCDRADKQVSLPSNCPPGNPGSALKYTSADSLCYFNSYELDSKSGWSKLLRLMATLNQDVSQIEKYLDVDRALWMLALNNFYVNLDSYSGSGHNYLIYENNLHRFNTIPWDLNEYYGAFTNAGTGQSLNVLQMQQLDPLLHLSNMDRPLISKLLSNPKWKKRYLAHLFTILTDAKNTNGYEQDGLALQNTIRSSVNKDVNKFFAEVAFNTNLYNDFTNMGGMGGKTYPGLISLTNARINFLNNHSSLNITKPSISDVNSIPVVVYKNEIINIRATITNASSTKLFYRYDKTQLFLETDMYDDGLHQDELAGDGIFGAQIDIQNNLQLQYYIYTENTNIASLSPARAEYEFYTIQVKTIAPAPGEIILNELMASNTNYIKDESGHYDDWIEIYNTTDRDISCAGLYLSDNPLNKLKWKFPDTLIKSKSFLIVWADENGPDPGLHANFKLSKAGEQLSLYTSDSMLLDHVVFPALDDNKTYGICNNTWAFTKTPTFAKPNDCVITNSNEIDVDGSLYIQPNPFDHSFRIILQGQDMNSILITDLLGRKIFFQKNVKTNFDVDASLWSSGIYFLSCESENKKQSIRIVKF